MPRFFTENAPQDGYLLLTGEDARHIAKSLRMQPGEELTVCDGHGIDHACVIEQVDTDTVRARVCRTQPSVSEPRMRVTLYMALPKNDKMELIVQKTTELGVTDIVPVLTARCVSRPDARTLEKKIDRWSKIAAEAAKQSGRGRIPRVHPALGLGEALAAAAQADVALLLYECEREHGLRAALTARTPCTVSVLVGPEGGFAPEEARQAQDAGLVSVSLGPRILRCETAPIAALACILYECGDL